MGWTCNTVGKMRFASVVVWEMPPNINTAVQYTKRDLRKTGYVPVRLNDMSSRVQGRTLMLTVSDLRFLSSTSSLISKTGRRNM